MLFFHNLLLRDTAGIAWPRSCGISFPFFRFAQGRARRLPRPRRPSGHALPVMALPVPTRYGPGVRPKEQSAGRPCSAPAACAAPGCPAAPPSAPARRRRAKARHRAYPKGPRYPSPFYQKRAALPPLQLHVFGFSDTPIRTAHGRALPLSAARRSGRTRPPSRRPAAGPVRAGGGGEHGARAAYAPRREQTTAQKRTPRSPKAPRRPYLRRTI